MLLKQKKVDGFGSFKERFLVYEDKEGLGEAVKEALAGLINAVTVGVKAISQILTQGANLVDHTVNYTIVGAKWLKEKFSSKTPDLGMTIYGEMFKEFPKVDRTGDENLDQALAFHMRASFLSYKIKQLELFIQPLMGYMGNLKTNLILTHQARHENKTKLFGARIPELDDEIKVREDNIRKLDPSADSTIEKNILLRAKRTERAGLEKMSSFDKYLQVLNLEEVDFSGFKVERIVLDPEKSGNVDIVNLSKYLLPKLNVYQKLLEKYTDELGAVLYQRDKFFELATGENGSLGLKFGALSSYKMQTGTITEKGKELIDGIDFTPDDLSWVERRMGKKSKTTKPLFHFRLGNTKEDPWVKNHSSDKYY